MRTILTFATIFSDISTSMAAFPCEARMQEHILYDFTITTIQLLTLGYRRHTDGIAASRFRDFIIALHRL